MDSRAEKNDEVVETRESPAPAEPQLPAYKLRQRELAQAAKLRRVLPSSAIRAYAEKKGISAISSKVIVDSFKAESK